MQKKQIQRIWTMIHEPYYYVSLTLFKQLLAHWTEKCLECFSIYNFVIVSYLNAFFLSISRFEIDILLKNRLEVDLRNQLFRYNFLLESHDTWDHMMLKYLYPTNLNTCLFWYGNCINKYGFLIKTWKNGINLKRPILS